MLKVYMEGVYEETRSAFRRAEVATGKTCEELANMRRCRTALHSKSGVSGASRDEAERQIAQLKKGVAECRRRVGKMYGRKWMQECCRTERATEELPGFVRCWQLVPPCSQLLLLEPPPIAQHL